TGACRQSERTVLPDSLAAAHQETAGEVASGEIVVAGDRDERTLEPPGHVADEASLAAAGRPLEHDWQPAPASRAENRDLVFARPVVGLGRNVLEGLVVVASDDASDGSGRAHAFALTVPRGG